MTTGDCSQSWLLLFGINCAKLVIDWLLVTGADSKLLLMLINTINFDWWSVRLIPYTDFGYQLRMADED